MTWALLWLASASPDLYAPAFVKQVEERAAAACSHASFTIDRPWTRDEVAALRRITAPEHEGKQLYVQFLKDRHGYDIARVNRLYRLDSGSFTELLIADFKTTDRERAEVRADDDAFLAILAEHVEGVVARAWRKSCAGDRRRVGVVFARESIRVDLR